MNEKNGGNMKRMRILKCVNTKAVPKRVYQFWLKMFIQYWLSVVVNKTWLTDRPSENFIKFFGYCTVPDLIKSCPFSNYGDFEQYLIQPPRIIPRKFRSTK